jgi:hypothetical protein
MSFVDLKVHHNVIYQYNNFLSKKQLTDFKKVLDTLPEDKQSWTPPGADEFWSGKSYVYDHPEFLKVWKQVKNLFIGCSDIELNGIYEFSRTLVTDKPMGVHKDNLDCSSLKYGVVIYLNDDYEGGEISYPDFDFIIKPTAGMMVAHPGDLSHGVLPITKGNARYILTTFVKCPHEKESCNFQIKK